MNPHARLRTGLAALDRILGGIGPGDLVLLAGDPSVGKTALALTVARRVAMSGRRPVFCVSLKDARPLLVERLLCAQALIDPTRLRRALVTREDWDRIEAAEEALSAAPIYLDAVRAPTLRRLRAGLRGFAADEAIHAQGDPGLIVVDGLEAVGGLEARKRRGRTGPLKALARELGIPILVTARTRGGEGGRLISALDPVAAALSRGADAMLVLHRDDEDAAREDDGVLEVIASSGGGAARRCRLALLSRWSRVESLGAAGSGASGR